MLDRLMRRFAKADDAPARDIGPPPYPLKTLSDHLAPAGRKRVLALDGGGVRGAMSVAVLERIEALLRARHGGRSDFRLCDYFDLIGGTSTGAIIAGALAAKRLSAAEIKDFYFTMGPEVFKKSMLRQGLTRAVFDSNRLKSRLQEVFGELTLGDASVATGLAVVTKRVDTDSVWVLHNHPEGRYFDDPPPGIPKKDRYIGNRHYPIVNIVRASTAAPHFFKPERIEVVKGEVEGLFMDGGVTPHNNPAFQLLMLAGLRNYSFNWTLNADNLLMISIGTGSMADKTSTENFARRLQIFKTLDALTSMISGAEDFIELLMQWVGDSPDPRTIDSEVGDLREEFIANEPLLAYQRYQSILTADRLSRDFGVRVTDNELKTIRTMTDPKALQLSYEVGQAMAERLIKDEHFPARFDLNAAAAPAEQTLTAAQTTARPRR